MRGANPLCSVPGPRPTEVVAWTLLGSVWDASAIAARVPLGAGRPVKAKLSAHKSMLMASVVSLVAIPAFLSPRNVLPGWLSPAALSHR